MKKDFITKDLYLVAFLLSQGLQPIQITRLNPREVNFTFTACEELCEGFFSGKIKVEPLKFVAAIKQAKSIIYGIR